MSTRASTKKTARKSSRPASKKTATRNKTAATKKRARVAPARPKRGTKKAGKAGTRSAKGLKIRMYRVGFGDFFLITVPTSGGDRYIVIDCGVFKGTSGTGDIGSIEEAVDDLYETTGGDLALVIMTHRHADHIAGFTRAEERFRNDFKASMVWMPYWEQYNDAKDSPSNLQFQIEALAFQLAMQFRGREDEEARQALDLLWDATGIDFNAVAKGEKKKGGSNAKALDLLKNHLGSNGKNVRYYAAGDEAELPKELKGLEAVILGPPPKDAQVFMKLTDLKVGVGQYLDSTTSDEDGVKAIQPFSPQWCADPQRDYPANDAQGRPIDYPKMIETVANSQPDMLLAAAKKIDTFLNNQSLVVLFKFGGKNLLFVGDAQAGNWEHWLYNLDAPVKDPTKAGDLTEESQQILQAIDFYKVGHHGSTNSTPIQVVEALANAVSGKGLVAMCSTEPDVYGNTDKGTEVPRHPLMKALGDDCALVRSDAFAIKTKSVGSIKAAKGVGTLPKPKAGKLTKGDLYIEYSF